MREPIKYENWPHQQLTGQIIKAFFQVYNTLGEGFLEKVYERAMVIQVRSMGLLVQQQQPIKVHYHYQIVGDYFADLIVGAAVIVELKAAEGLCDADASAVD